jgi:hypothetical protein
MSFGCLATLFIEGRGFTLEIGYSLVPSPLLQTEIAANFISTLEYDPQRDLKSLLSYLESSVWVGLRRIALFMGLRVNDFVVTIWSKLIRTNNLGAHKSLIAAILTHTLVKLSTETIFVMCQTQHAADLFPWNSQRACAVEDCSRFQVRSIIALATWRMRYLLYEIYGG